MKHFILLIFMVLLLNACSKDEGTTAKEDENKTETHLNCDNDLGIVINGTLTHNSEMTFTSETNLFGDNGPDLIYRSDLSTASEDTRYDISQAEGLGSVALEGVKAPLVEKAEGMPFNKAFVIGSEGGLTESPDFGSIRVLSPLGSTPATYEHVMYWWPKGHQENAQPHLTDRWQIKTIWHFYTGSKGDERIRFHNGFGAFFDGPAGKYFKISALVGNLGPDYSWHPGFGDDDYTTNSKSSYMKEDKFISQTFIKHSPLDDGSGIIDVYLRNVDKGNVGHKTKTDTRTSIPAALDNHLGPDQFTFPGYSRGFNTQVDAHAYFSDVYIAHGVGAAARIELVNNSDYEKASKISPFTVQSWSSNAITVKCKMGIFSTQMSEDEDLYLAIHDEDNKLVGMIEYCGPRP